MSDYVLTVPEEVYTRAPEIANEIAQPVEQVMIDQLRTLSSPLPNLPPEEEAELSAMHSLSDDALWTIAREHMAKSLQKHMQQLMDKNSRGTLMPEERSELAALDAAQVGSRGAVDAAWLHGNSAGFDYEWLNFRGEPPKDWSNNGRMGVANTARLVNTTPDSRCM